MARCFAAADHSAINITELAWMLAECFGKARSRIDLRAESGHDVALLVVFCLVGQRGERAL